MVSCVSISCIARVQLIAAGNHLQTLILKKLVEKDKVEITRNGKIFRHSKIDQARSDMVPESSVCFRVLESDNNSSCR